MWSSSAHKTVAPNADFLTSKYHLLASKTFPSEVYSASLYSRQFISINILLSLIPRILLYLWNERVSVDILVRLLKLRFLSQSRKKRPWMVGVFLKYLPFLAYSLHYLVSFFGSFKKNCFCQCKFRNWGRKITFQKYFLHLNLRLSQNQSVVQSRRNRLKHARNQNTSLKDNYAHIDLSKIADSSGGPCIH